MIKALYKNIVPLRFRISIWYIYFKLRWFLFYRGDKYKCNCCGKTSRKFLNYGVDNRRNAACPYCNSLERHRILYYFLMNNNLLSEGKRILHFAPERIIERNIKRVRGIEYISADINKHIADEIVDIQNIHYPDSYFDLIICSHVLAHVEDEKKSLEEMYRVLRKGGLAIIMTKIDKNLIKTLEIKDVDSREMVEYFRKMEIYRIHSIDFAEIIKNVGFSVDVVDYVSVVGEAIANYHAFSSNDLLYLCYK